jgi:type IX secretion system PorP/SprF family membrane protein
MFRRFIYRLILILLFCHVFEKQVEGQEYPWSLQYVTNMYTLNPAYVGIWDKAGLIVSTKTNWVGIKGAPLSQYVGYFTPIKDQRSGVGLSIQRQNIGLEKRISFTGDYSYQIRTDMTHYLRFGLRAGIINFDNNLTDYQLYPDQIPDPEFTTDIRLYNMAVFGIGAVFFNNDYYISLSIPQIISNTFQVNKNLYSSLENTKSIYLNGGYVFSWRKSIRFRPNLLVIGTTGKPVFLDAAALVYLPSNLQFGLNLRSNGSLCVSAQYTFKNSIRIGYAADYAVISDIRKYQLGTYEILIGYDYNIFKRKYTKPNYF